MSRKLCTGFFVGLMLLSAPSVLMAQSVSVVAPVKGQNRVAADVTVTIYSPATGPVYTPNPANVQRNDTVHWYISGSMFQGGETGARVEGKPGAPIQFTTPYGGPGRSDLVSTVIPGNAPVGLSAYQIRFDPSGRVLDPSINVVPATTPWGMLLAALLMLTAGILFMVRRRPSQVA